MAYDPNKKTVYILYENDGDHTCFYDRNSRKDGYAIPLVYLKDAVEEAGYNFEPTFDYTGLAAKTDVAYILSLTLLNQPIIQSVAQHPKEKCFLFNLEPTTTHALFYSQEITNYFGKVFVMFDDLVDNQRFFKFYHPQCNEEVAQEVPSFAEKKLCVMVQANHFVAHPLSEYAERRKAAEFFSKTNEFDLYGNRWDGYAAWRGAFRTGKQDVIKNYKFCLAFENMKEQNGYMTERLFDAMYAKCIPIYLGPKNIEKYVPKECFVNRAHFSSYEDLYQFMKSMDQKTYDRYIAAAQDYIRSPQAEVFSTKQFARTVLEHIHPRRV